MSRQILLKEKMLFKNNNIPLESYNGSWEYVKDMINETEEENIPIKEMGCQSEVVVKELSEKIINFIKSVNIEKGFKINLQNILCANIVKNTLDDIVNKITIYPEKNNQFESYTILIMDRLLKGNKIIRRKEITLNIIGKSINGINMWCCNDAMKL
jgi:hypothetical protein